MKKIALYILLIAYVAIQLKPLTAMANDVLSHTFFKARHLATIHYENGKYHLHAELETITKEDPDLSNDKTTSLKKIEQPQDKTSNYSFYIREINSLNRTFWRYLPDQLSAGFLCFSFPPPEVA